jgi:hypothetical protein
MGLTSGRSVLALDASGLAGAAVKRTFRGAEVRSAERVSLEPGALVPSPTEPNLARPAAVKAALTELLDRLGRPARATVVLPLGLARLSLLDLPEGTEAREYARFRLAPGLPFPLEEALVDVVPAGGARVLAAAVRRQVVAGYEELLAGCGVEVERVDLMPLAAVTARRRERRPAGIDVFLGDVAFAVAFHEGGALRAFRSRWRGRGADELVRIGRTLESALRAHSGPVTPRVLVFGPASHEIAAGLSSEGLAASPGPEDTLLGAAA